MTPPEVRIIGVLFRAPCDRTTLMRRTRLAAVTFEHTLGKLQRMGYVEVRNGAFRLGAGGIRVARELRDR